VDINVPMGEMKVAVNGDCLTSLGIGSCLVVTLYDSRLQNGGLAHTMLAGYRLSSKLQNPCEERRIENKEVKNTKFVDTAIDEMLKKLEAHGTKREDLGAKLIGGANMFAGLVSDIGQNNIATAKEKLKKEKIKVIGEVVGGSKGRSVEFSTGTGIVTVKTKF